MRRRQFIPRSEQPIRLHCTPLRETEVGREGLGHQLGEERATEERSTHDVDRVASELDDQCLDERRDGLRIREESIQIQPEGAVVAGFQSEVAAPALGQA